MKTTMNVVWAAGLLAVGMIVGGWVGHMPVGQAADYTPQVLRARELQLVDENGRVYLWAKCGATGASMLLMTPGGDQSIALSTAAVGEQSSCVLVGAPKGSNMMLLTGVFRDRTTWSSLALSDGRGTTVGTISGTETLGSWMLLRNPDGTERRY